MQADRKSNGFTRSPKFAEFYQKKSAFFSESKKLTSSASCRTILPSENTKVTRNPQNIAMKEQESRQDSSKCNRFDSERSLRVIHDDHTNGSTSVITDTAHEAKYSSTMRKVYLEQMFREKQKQLRQKREKDLQLSLNRNPTEPLHERLPKNVSGKHRREQSFVHQGNNDALPSYSTYEVSSVHVEDLGRLSSFKQPQWDENPNRERNTRTEHLSGPKEDEISSPYSSDNFSRLSCSIQSFSCSGSKLLFEKDLSASISNSLVSGSKSHASIGLYDDEATEVDDHYRAEPCYHHDPQIINDSNKQIMSESYSSSMSSDSDTQIDSWEENNFDTKERSSTRMPEKNFFFESLRKVIHLFDDSPSNMNAAPPLDSVVFGLSTSGSSEYSAVSYHS